VRSNMFSGLGRGIRRSCKDYMEIGVGIENVIHLWLSIMHVS
jgi:hypothetical protein